jgi:predicted MPP superfamily phosphohydrolase
LYTAIVHLSDIHYRHKWDENHGVVFRALFQDLRKQLQLLEAKDVYLVLSGDVVNAGDNSDSYDEFTSKFDDELTSLKIQRSRRICVPGNHDISTKQIKLKKVDHEGVVSQNLEETSFNDYSENPSSVFKSKFKTYSDFESNFASYTTLGVSPIGCGWEITGDIGVYCLNSAFFSSGGLADRNGNKLEDRGRLAVNTRGLHSWNRDCKARCKILVMHHPLEWLTEWAQREIRILLNNEFTLCLSGHAHNQSLFHSINKQQSLVEISAPPLFTNKIDELGYSIVLLSSTHEVSSIIYRQWTKHQSFVPGVNFANNEDGKIIIRSPTQSNTSTEQHEGDDSDVVDDYLTKNLDKALKAFPSQPRVWIEPTLSKRSELDRASESKNKVSLADMIGNPRSTIIKAPPQFGLTCLAHYLTREAWRRIPSSLWLYLDSRMLKPSINNIKRATNAELGRLGHKFKDVRCVILDSWQLGEKKAYHLLKAVCSFFNDIPIIVMQSIDDRMLLNTLDDEGVNREFDVLYLWALSREHVRAVVNIYNDERHIGDEDAVTSKIVADLDVLNIHRTPLNCLTVLKASEYDFDHSPVNRTEMLRRVLFLLFNTGDIPTYKDKPDMKDCEYVLGYFCESMIRKDAYFFTRKHFVETLKVFCHERVLALDVQMVFDILYENHVLVTFGSYFCFKFTYWVYYFAAQRMHHDQSFAEFMYVDMYYARFPEVIEFYTGIDRRREDALSVLIKDLKHIIATVQAKCGLPSEINPYKFIQWQPSTETLKQMKSEIYNGVAASNLPAAIKDRYADSGYDRRRPYHQEVRAILIGDSLASMILIMKAASRAMRNSDYAVPDVKRALLTEILNGWKQLSQVLLVLYPLLAFRGHTSFDGMAFRLGNDFGDTFEMRLRNILMQIPTNVVSWYKDDIFSQKIGPLLIEKFSGELDDIKKHELVLLLIEQRPRGWKVPLKKYIVASTKNSFYLCDVMMRLHRQYEYSYATPHELKDIEYLIKMSAAKHFYGTKKPGMKAIKKISDSVLPKRTID